MLHLQHSASEAGIANKVYRRFFPRSVSKVTQLDKFGSGLEREDLGFANPRVQ
jgi:hypothetical protein